MKRHWQIAGFGGLLTLLISTAAVAEAASAAESYYVDVPVVEARPIVHRRLQSVPREECRQVRRSVDHDRHQRRIVPTLVGGLLGGAIGRQFGGGRGRDLLTAAGALAGANMASDRGRHRDGVRLTRQCRRVETVREVEVVDAWEVTWLYQGEEFTRTMDRRPGERIRVRVTVEPMVGTPRAERIADASSDRLM